MNDDVLVRQSIERSCQTLVLRAAHCADTGNAQAHAQLFTPDGVLMRPNAAPLVGREAIAAAYAQRPADRITRHLVTNTLVDVVSPTQAHALSYVLLWSGSTDSAAGPQGRQAHPKQMVGEFKDVLVQGPQGWLIQQREASFVLYAER